MDPICKGMLEDDGYQAEGTPSARRISLDYSICNNRAATREGWGVDEVGEELASYIALAEDDPGV
jgi:hypothetical protein